MDINKYALFVDVAETGNFTKTGERMGYTQPGVSHILKSMEAELGFPLFIRTRHGISLTSNAEAILPIVRNMLSILLFFLLYAFLGYISFPRHLHGT